MTVGELIKELQAYDPETEVRIQGAFPSHSGEGMDFFETEPFINKHEGVIVLTT
jgi:hypothetical protein